MGPAQEERKKALFGNNLVGIYYLFAFLFGCHVNVGVSVGPACWALLRAGSQPNAPAHALGAKSQILKASEKKRELSQSPGVEMEFVQPSEPRKAGKTRTGRKHVPGES